MHVSRTNLCLYGLDANLNMVTNYLSMEKNVDIIKRDENSDHYCPFSYHIFSVLQMDVCTKIREQGKGHQHSTL